MAQKALFKKGKGEKKKVAANRHGKKVITKKGKFQKDPKKLSTLQKMDLETTLLINKKNEGNLAVAAAASGGTLSVLKPDQDRVEASRKDTLPKKKSKAAKPVVERVSAHL